MYMNTPRLQRGLSLVEVFVALLVLSVGLIALAKLQVDLVRGSSDARTRTIALSLAEEKVEDLRTFVRTDGSGTWSITANPMAWSYIANPGDPTCPYPYPCGGRIAPQPTYSSTLEVAGVQFLRTWTVTDRNFGTGPITTRTKDVTVSVSWVNEAGDPPNCTPPYVKQCVNLVASVVEIPPNNVALASEPVADPPDGPQIPYMPGVAPEIISIPIDTGTGKRETTKPLPDVQARGDYAHEVHFDVVNYHLEGSQNVVDRREEFVTVNCRCALAGPGPGRTPARVAFTGNILRDAPGKVIADKSQTGVLLTSGADSVSQQPTLCAICCRDHHDGPDETVGSDTDHNRYNPTVDDDHAHYLFAPNGDSVINAADFDLASSAGDPYDEACRLKRINGVFQVFEDWNLATILAMPENDLTVTSIQGAYTAFVQGFVQDSADGGDPPAPGDTSWISTTTLVPGGAAQLSGRAIYIDRMPQNLLDFLSTSPPPDNFLSYVPFYEVNLTKLANWKLQYTGTDNDYETVDGQTCSGTVSQDVLTEKIACIANQKIVDENIANVGAFQNYFRGLLKAGPLTGNLDAQVAARSGNSGLAGTFAISFSEHSATPVTSEYNFSNEAGDGVSGAIHKGNDNNFNGMVCNYKVNGGSSTPCPLEGTGSSARTFTFDVPSAASVEFTVTNGSDGVCPASVVTVTAPDSSVCFKLDNDNSCTGADLTCP